MSDRSDAAALSYLERLLRVAVTQRGAPPDTVAGRVMVPVLGMAMAYGGSDLIAAYLTPEPDTDAIYQVRRQGPDDAEPTVLSDDLNAVAALRAAVRHSRDGIGGVHVVGRTEAGVVRRSLNRTTDGVLEYVFPEPDAFTGPQGAVRSALRRWDDSLDRWAAEVGTAQPAAAEPGATVPGATEPGATSTTTASTTITSGTPAPGAPAGAPNRPRTRPDRALERRGADRIPTAAEIAAAIQSSLMEMTVDINLNEVESLIRRTIQSTFGELTATAATPPPIAVTPVAAVTPDTDQLVERIGNRVVEQITPLLASAARASAEVSAARAPVLDDRAAEQLAAMVAYQINSFLEALSPNGIGPVEALQQIEPLLGEIDATQKQFLAQATSQVGFESRIGTAVEQLDLQMHELREHTRTSATALRSLAEQVATLSRRSDAAGERLSAAVGRELDQFGDRFKHQLESVESAAKRNARDLPVPDGVGRLTAKLAQSVAQLDQLLNRMTEMTPPEPTTTLAARRPLEPRRPLAPRPTAPPPTAPEPRTTTAPRAPGPRRTPT